MGKMLPYTKYKEQQCHHFYHCRHLQIHLVIIGVERNRKQETGSFQELPELVVQEHCIQDIPIKHQQSRILVKQQDLAQPLI